MPNSVFHVSFRESLLLGLSAFSVVTVFGFIAVSHHGVANAKDPRQATTQTTVKTAKTASKQSTPSGTNSPAQAAAPQPSSLAASANSANSSAATVNATASATSTTAVPAATPPAAPRSSSLYVYPDTSAAVDTRAWMAQRGYDPGLQRVIDTPMAAWYGGWTANIRAVVNGYVTAATQVGKLPVLVAYNIPNRDCGGQSAGGAATAADYAQWIAEFSTGIGKRAAIVIIEPDALAASCYSDTRAAMIASAVDTLASTTAASLYLDAGNASWQPGAVMAPRLQKAGLARATGFSLNVSNFESTVDSQSYGDALSRLVGGKHYVVDTSRNGNGPAGPGQWCNPAGRAVGQTPSLQTGRALVDAYLWIKTVGESDGACGSSQGGTSAPPAGVWWPEYALMLVRNAGW